MYKLYMATVELTRACNAKCKHCIADAGAKKNDELSTERLITLIEELNEQGCEFVIFTGGEALLRKDWAILVQKASMLDMQIVLMSNGLLINDDVIKILQMYDVSLGISLDGPNALIHDEIRGVKGIFDNFVNLIPKLKKANVYTTIATTVMKSNILHIDEIKDLLLKLKVDRWQLQIMKPCKRASDDEVISEIEYYDLAKKIVDYRKKYSKKMEIVEADCIGYNSKLSPNLSMTEWKGCECGIHSVSIESDGNVKGCPNMTNSEGNIANIPFKEIWMDHSKFAYNRRPDLSKLTGYCNECEHRFICRGGCPTNPINKISNTTYCLHKIEQYGIN